MPRLGFTVLGSARHPSAAAALGAPAWPRALLSVRMSRDGGRWCERLCRPPIRHPVLLQQLLDAGHIGTDERGVGDHHRLMPVADVVREQRPLLRRARLDDEYR